jgi:hypothetical protein
MNNTDLVEQPNGSTEEEQRMDRFEKQGNDF